MFDVAYLKLQVKYCHDSAKWLHDILGFTCIPWQEEACHDYDRYGRCAWSTGSGVGKTSLLAGLILHFLATRPYPAIPCTAPTQRQLFNALWAEIARHLNKNPRLYDLFEWTQTKVYLKTNPADWFAVAITSKPKPGMNTIEALQGIHAEHVLAVVDEASGIAEPVMGAIDGLLTTPNARAILASNPTRNTGYFHKATHDLQISQLWKVKFVDASLIDAPFLDKASFERLKVIYGENSDYYRMRVRGIPPRTEASVLISPEQVYAAHERIIEPVGDKFMSLDCARFGDDDSVWFVRQGNTVIERVAAHGMDTEQATRQGLKLFELHNPVEYRIDEIGIGSGVVDSTKHKLGTKKSRVVPVNVGESAINNEEFYNKRAEILWDLRTAIDDISLYYVDTPLLDEELVELRYGWDTKDKKIQFEPKKKMKVVLGRSPNDTDSLAMLCAKLKSAARIVSSSYFSVGQKIKSTPPSKVDKPIGLFAVNLPKSNRFSEFSNDYSKFENPI